VLRKKYFLFIFTIALLGILQSLPAMQVSKWEWQGVERVVAIGDVHGEYDKLVPLLTGIGLTDSNLKWIGGKAHLILCGDLLDRGKKERAVMDLLMRLQQEAKKDGGKVHVLLGNHDVMNLVRDLRYVDKANYADFSKEEKSRDRKRGFDSFKRLYADQKLKEAQLRAAFDEKYPPGYFGRLKAFELRGKYGAWLLDHPTLIKINDVVYVHAGLREEVSAAGIEKTNKQVQKSIKDFVRHSRTLEPYIKGPAGFDEFYAAALAIAGESSSGQIPRELADAARGMVRELEGLVFSPNGPFWYRGNSQEDENFEWYHIRESLKHLGSKKLVIAHTPTKNGTINARFSDSLYRTDVGMVYGHLPLALELTTQQARVFDPNTSTYAAPVQEEIHGEGASQVMGQLPEPQMIDFMLTAAIVDSEEVERFNRKWKVVELEKDHNHRRAIFLAVTGKKPTDQKGRLEGYRHYKHGYAAYLFDREVGTNLVPTTVLREIDGQPGILQLWPARVAILRTLKRGGGGFDIQAAFKNVKDQVVDVNMLAALFDTRDVETDITTWYLPEEKRLLAADGTKAFTLSPEIQEQWLYFDYKGEHGLELTDEDKRQLMLSPSLDLALRSLNFEGLKELLGAYLDDDEIRALLTRRDKLLELCSPEYQTHNRE
jgi:hypothetical protein